MPTFRELFLELTGHAPFPWQERLFSEFVEGEFRNSCDVPTGLGKTSVIAIWLLALAHKISAAVRLKGFPRRLIYVVNRRTVVDQATREGGTSAGRRSRLRRNSKEWQEPCALWELVSQRSRCPSARQGANSQTMRSAGPILRGLLSLSGPWT